MKKIINIIAFSLIIAGVAAQKNSIKSDFGVAAHLNKGAIGFAMGTEYTRQVSKKGYIGVEINYNFTSRRGLLPQDLKGQRVILRDFTQPVTLYPPYFEWTAESFPGYRLPSKPDKYFNCGIGVKYLHDIWSKNKHQLRTGLGVVLTFNDEKEIVEMLKGDFYSPLFKEPISNVLIPIFKYDTYIDLGFQPQIEYHYQIKKRMSIGLLNKYYCYPKSSRYLATLSAFMNFYF